MSPGYFGLRDYLRTVQNKQSAACIISGLVRPCARARARASARHLRRAVLDYPSLKRNTRNVPGMTIYGHYHHLCCHTCKWMYLAYMRAACSISLAPTNAPPRAPVARAFLGGNARRSLLAQLCGWSFRVISDAPMRRRLISFRGKLNHHHSSSRSLFFFLSFFSIQRAIRFISAFNPRYIVFMWRQLNAMWHHDSDCRA